jgi:hypothetical protein
VIARHVAPIADNKAMSNNDRHPLSVAAHILFALAVTAAATGLSVMAAGALTRSTAAFFAGIITLCAAATLMVQAGSLAARARQVAVPPQPLLNYPEQL